MTVEENRCCGEYSRMLNQRTIIENVFALPRVICALLGVTLLVLSVYANDEAKVDAPENVASVKTTGNVSKSKL